MVRCITRGTISNQYIKVFRFGKEKPLLESNSRMSGQYHHYLDEKVDIQGRGYGLSLTYYLYDIITKRLALLY